MNRLILHLLGQKPGAKILSATSSFTSILNETNDRVDWSTFDGTSMQNLMLSKSDIPLSSKYDLKSFVVVLLMNFDT